MSGHVVVTGGDPDWLRDALAALGIAAHVQIEGVRIPLPAGATAFARLGHALDAALRPAALLLDLDGVLADLEGRRPIANVDDVAALAAQLPLAVVTSCPQRLADSVLVRHGFAPHVRTVVAAEHGPGKPSPEPVRLALSRLGVGAAWMLGDNPSDVLAARGAGVVPLAVRPHGIGAESHAARLCEAGAARLVDGLADLRALLRSWPSGPRSP